MSGFLSPPSCFHKVRKLNFRACMKVDAIIFAALLLLLFPQQSIKAYNVALLSGEAGPFRIELDELETGF